ncbi:PREDICTED: omega-hydroxypalmitate O-feruloyl transferase [Tarenaya hassleriana]|uniref:omega-hydroxypalmitate O-feruloyl transferase n=1 Tax=Tarenaya hassleriana TaxID=28532 RepID=UPI00053C6BB4|nr:PREDICTED: omega-hydroxypalmitate O-feruloyl transferase [Tarenaya hassleriana]
MQELPDCVYERDEPNIITPKSPTPNHCLYLSNLDDHHFLRFSIKYLYVFQKPIDCEILRDSLSRVLVDYYPLAGRIRAVKPSGDRNQNKLEIDCNGQGAVFAEAFMDITSNDFLQLSRKPNRSWRKLLFKAQASSFLDIPPLVIQVTKLRCGGMILCTAINHCLCDGIGTSQFFHAWAHLITGPYHDHHLPIQPFHFRHVLKPRDPPRVTHSHPGFTRITLGDQKASSNIITLDVTKYLQSQPLSPATLTFTPSLILRLKKTCAPSLKCTAFEALAAHTWRSWAHSLDLPLTMPVKLLFSVNVRKKLTPELPQGYYGNGFVLACAETKVQELVNMNISHAVKLVQEAKSKITDDYIRSMVDLLEDKTVKTDVSCALVISQWAKFGLEDLDLGGGKPLYMGSLTSDIYCLFLPVAGNFDAVRVQVSMPEDVVKRFEYRMVECFGRKS